MKKIKLNLSLLVTGLAMSCGAGTSAAEAGAAKPALPPASTKQGVTFAADIKPLFEASCVQCHTGQRAKAKLQLNTLEGVLAGSEDGKVVIPGNSEKSSIVLAVARVNPRTAMPPEPRQRRGPGAPAAPPQTMTTATDGIHATPVAADAGTAQPPTSGQEGSGSQGQAPRGNQAPPPKPLTTEEVALVRAWIDQGAK